MQKQVERSFFFTLALGVGLLALSSQRREVRKENSTNLTYRLVSFILP